MPTHLRKQTSTLRLSHFELLSRAILSQTGDYLALPIPYMLLRRLLPQAVAIAMSTAASALVSVRSL